MRSAHWTAALILSLAAAVPAHGQSPQPVAGKGSIAGVVLDSLHGGFLRDADVMIDGATRAITTDSSGRFFADGLSPGSYQIGVFHPLLDTLGVSLSTKPFTLGRDSTSVVILAVPSAASLVARSCAGRPMRLGASAIVGRVLDPETLDPVPRAEVSVAWMQFDATKELGVRSTPRLLHDTTDKNGAYRICGLPPSLDATLQAKRGAARTAEVPVALGEAESELLARTLLLTKADSAPRVGRATIAGRVTLSGAPGGGSRVEIGGTDLVTMTNEKGEFSMSGAPAGTHVLNVRHMGYLAVTVPVNIAARDLNRVNIDMPRFVPVMDPVLVTARRSRSLDRVGFSERRRSGAGSYVTREEIERSNPIYMSDILRRIPGLRVSRVGGRDVITSSRGSGSFGGAGCVRFWVDDMLWHSIEPGDVNDFVSAREVMGIEVYNGGFGPARYTLGGQSCTTVIVWTRVRIGDI